VIGEGRPDLGLYLYVKPAIQPDLPASLHGDRGAIHTDLIQMHPPVLDLEFAMYRPKP
jgi:hypothetical protein